METSAYHIHTYFDSGSRASAEKLREELRRQFSGIVRVFEMVDEPIGPHPLPMFEAHVLAENMPAVRTWLERNHGPHSVLLHPLTGDELADHRDFPVWIGPPLNLDLEFLARLPKRKH